MIVEEGGKLYNIDEDTGLVTEASDQTILDEEFHIGDRVEVTGSVGEIVSMVPNLYGVAFGVRFDDGDFDEFLESQLKRSSADAPIYDSELSEVVARYASYQEMPLYTNDEIDSKEAEARWLKLRAGTLVNDKALSLGEQNRLGEIILTTTSDLKDFDSYRVTTDESQQYLGKFHQYKIADDVAGYGAAMGGKDDASWLDTAAEGMEVKETTDADLAARATEVAASLSRDQLENDELVAEASAYQRSYLQMNEDQVKKFNGYLTNARKQRLEELPKEQKTASTFNLDDATDIFI